MELELKTCALTVDALWGNKYVILDQIEHLPKREIN